MLIDTHSHLNFSDFERDLKKVIKRCQKTKVLVINVGTNYRTSKKGVEIANNFEGVYPTVGLHPINIKTTSNLKENSEEVLKEKFDYQRYKELAQSEKVVGIGEIGLDYWKKPKTKLQEEEFKEIQKEIFLTQLKLAKELQKAIIFHCRLAHQDLLKELEKKEFQGKIKGVLHCFTGSWKVAQRYLKLGFYLGFNGIIFKLNLTEIIKKIPLERILIETDCPFLTPPGVGVSRNEPIFVKSIAQRIAEIKKEKFENIAKITTENAKELFNLKNITS